MQIINLVPLFGLLSAMADVGLPVASTAVTAAPVPGTGIVGAGHLPVAPPTKREIHTFDSDSEGPESELEKRKGGGGGRGGGGGAKGPKGGFGGPKSGSSGGPGWNIDMPTAAGLTGGGSGSEGKKERGDKSSFDKLKDTAGDKLDDLKKSFS